MDILHIGTFGFVASISYMHGDNCGNTVDRRKTALQFLTALAVSRFNLHDLATLKKTSYFQLCMPSLMSSLKATQTVKREMR
jgi:hypothetical protein